MRETDPAAVASWLESHRHTRSRSERLGGLVRIPAGFVLVALFAFGMGCALAGLILALGGDTDGWTAESWARAARIGLVIAPILLVVGLFHPPVPLASISRRPKALGPDISALFRAPPGHAERGGDAIGLAEKKLDSITESVLLGPGLIVTGLAAIARSRRLERMEIADSAAVLARLHAAEGRVAYEELARALPDVDLAIVLPALRDLGGVLFLRSAPPGLALESGLRRSLDGQIHRAPGFS